MRASVAALASRGPSEHMAQSSVGKVLERRAMYPPRDCSLSTRWTSIPAPASSSAAESPPMPPPTTSAERCRKVREGSSGRCNAARATAAASTVSAFRCALSGSCRWMNAQPSRRLAKATLFSPSSSSRAMRSKVGP